MSTENATERFLRYIAVDTASDENTGTSPSTKSHYVLAEMLIDELKVMGVPEEDIIFDSEYCYVYCRLKASEGAEESLPKIGFIAHMDTSPEAPGRCVSPRIIEDYDGCDIELGNGKILSPDGELLVLEFFRPGNALLGFFTSAWLRILSALFAARRASAYRYLRESMKGMMTAGEFVSMAEDEGFSLLSRRFFLPCCTCLHFCKPASKN